MKKAVYYGAGDVRIEEVPLPKIPLDGLLVKVKYCGICGSDVHEYFHGPFSGIFAPGVWGHEFSGEVIEVGPQVADYKPGDRVVGRAIAGAFAEYITGSARLFFKMDNRMSYEAGAVTEPTTVACYAVEKGAVRAGERALVVGAGPIGLLTILTLRHVGASPIYVSEKAPKRKKLAQELGADEVFDPSACNVVEEIRKRTSGRGVDVSFECVGLMPALLDCINATRRRKRVVIEGVFFGGVTLDFFELLQKDLSLLFSLGANFDATMPLIAEGKIPSAKIITNKIGLKDIIPRGINKLTGETVEEVKVLVSLEL